MRSMPELVRRFTIQHDDKLVQGALDPARQAGLRRDAVLPHVQAGGTNKPVTSLERRAVVDLASARQEAIVCASAADLLSTSLAEALGWKDLTLARLIGGDEELLGILCLAGRGPHLSPADRNLLQALCGHASVALENMRLFS